MSDSNITEALEKLESEEVSSVITSIDKEEYEKELALCKKAGANSDALRSLELNIYQLIEVRKGLQAGIDVKKYLNPEISWMEMEEIRTEMTEKLDLSQYRRDDFDISQIIEIRKGLQSKIDVSVYADHKYMAEQMEQIRLGLENEIPVIFYQDPAFDFMQMKEIRLGLEENRDISQYAMIDMPYMKMRIIRTSMADGLELDRGMIKSYSAAILEQIHQAFVDQVDIMEYVKKGFDEEQLEQIRIALRDGVAIEPYCQEDMRGEALRQIREGLSEGIDVTLYADSKYTWQQMEQIKRGLEMQVDAYRYANPLYLYKQMREIRRGLYNGVDVSIYSSMMHTPKEMRAIRKKLESGEYIPPNAVQGNDGEADSIRQKSNSFTNEDKLLMQKILNEDLDQVVSLSDDKMACWIKLPLRRDGRDYTVDFVLTLLFKAHVRKGIDRIAIDDMIAHHKYGQSILVASGEKPINGLDGFYEYFFKLDKTGKPTFLDDGTADFSIDDYLETVKVGDRIALYHKATIGTDGTNVCGEKVKARSGHEIPILKGSGFMLISDKVTYVATITGIIKKVGDEVVINRVYTTADVRITDKEVNFDGTVLIKGNVASGTRVKATGDVYIDGNMDSAVIISGGDVVIRRGSVCPIRGSIDAAGNVSGKFFEHVRIKAGGDVIANSFLNCTIKTSGKVIACGEEGTIYGGTIQSMMGVEAGIVGNRSNVKTIINMGVTGEILVAYNECLKNISKVQEELKAFAKERKRLLEVTAASKEIMQWKIKINAAASMKEKECKDLIVDRIEMEKKIARISGANAKIKQIVYAGTVILIDGVAMKIEHDEKSYGGLTFKKDPASTKVVMV